ncbi:MAG: TonB-dependent receptor [Acidobacteria bacterium]|nr:TonB-dependent receptor [Acidobacteriota bacterium]
MLRRQTVWWSVVVMLALAPCAWAGDIVGTAKDASGGVLQAARVVVRNLATNEESVTRTDATGAFRVSNLVAGSYLVIVEREGFSPDARTVDVGDSSSVQKVAATLVPGSVQVGVTVTAMRNERDGNQVPLRTDSLSRDVLESRAPASTGDALMLAAGVTPVGSGPVEVRPRVRGLDSTRLLVLVDGERLNNARTATDRSGTEVGLVDVNSVDNIEVVGGSGSVLYGTDALAGTVNIITNQPRFSDALRLTYGFDGLYSSNENGRRGTVSFGASGPRFAFQISGSKDTFDNYTAGAAGKNENTNAYFASGQIKNVDTIDTYFGFAFKAFPDPFNQAYTRTTAVIPTSGATSDNMNIGGLLAISAKQTLQVKYIRRRIENAGFPDFQQPTFFQQVSLPFNNLDRLSMKYEVRAITPWFTNLKVSGYFQDQNRLLRNQFPVQYPVPSPAFFPINVYQLQIVSDTQQHVRTPGVDVQATFVPARHHVVTAGVMAYDDRSEDSRTSSTQSTIIGNVALGARGPQANVFDTPTLVGAPSITHPVRVPNASFRDLGAYAQDEWDLSRFVRVVAGIRADQYSVATKATSGYTVDSLVAGAVPAIDPATLPSPGGDRISRRALTGDLGVVVKLAEGVTMLARYGRSYRHPNLEELLFAGPATVGAIAPNVTVRPETGDNVDVGLKIRRGRYAASAGYFTNTYHGFISTEIVSQTPSGPLSQAINFSDVRIQGVEGDVNVPIVLRAGVVTLFGTGAFTRGTVLAGANPLTGVSLAGTPQDNISPAKVTFGARFNDAHDRWWIGYDGRVQAKVTRVAPTLLDSPYLIAQDLLGLGGFTVHRLSAGVNLSPKTGRVSLVFAVENLADRFYREQFQFAPARGRSFTIGVHVKGL